MTVLQKTRLNSRRRIGPRISGRTIASLIAIGVGLVWAFPLYWMINTALAAPDQLRSSPPTLFPFAPTFDSFAKVLSDSSFWSSMAMSMQVTLIAVVVALLSATLAAVTLSRFRFRGRTSMIVAVLVVQMIPADALFISQFRMLGAVDLLNTVAGLSLLYVGSVLPFTVWMLKGFVDGVPIELEEAAMVDGCSKVGAFFRVTFPLLGPGMVATGVFAFLAAWNEYTLALVVLSSGTAVTLPVWLQGFQTSLRGTDWGGVMAGSTLIAVPVIILFIIVQNKMSTGMTAGAVKG
ncbi:carbohydrate ABC transporter membrane protein 2, CUT1 family [Arthrobacter alpinus]|uniref:Carbohydrate ABC transporter membrane protein 2, CUT1 family n=1 Tax=Arthrobacter alpinus TaxID=656366 RepID=A0A1H5PHD8_9MICC|nr:carbohydrate ABC transporter permease [Arthrobacter alpinus]SEF13279.1 carbohydrate ABC transporter membrane protein 2, CUT1 family [Arthrobacter alpinus]